MSPLGLGGATLGNLYAAMSDDEAAATVDAAWDAGIRLFDTAPHYGLGLSEERLGRALSRRPREEFVLSTKVGRIIDDGHEPRSDRDDLFDVTSTRRRHWDFSRRGVLRSLDDSRVRLRMDRIDVALVHDPDDHLDQATAEAIPALCDVRSDGDVGMVGIGVNRVDVALHIVERTDIDVVLIAGRLTLLDQSAAAELLPRCAERGILVVAAGVFNSGLLATAIARADSTYDYAPVDRAVVARLESITAACSAHGVEVPEAALRFPLRYPAVTSVLVSGRSPGEVIENADRVARADRRRPGMWDELWSALRDQGLIEVAT
jgi:D-threo-aldose 1-dehydrogenase